MDIHVFAEAVRDLVEKSPLFGDSELEAVLIANPRAGGFSQASRARAVSKDLAAATIRAAPMELRRGETHWRTLTTTEPRHASRIALALLEEAAMKPVPVWLIVMACGDGTSLEFLDELSRAPQELTERFTMLRLPMGTGNDGTDGRELSDALSRLTGTGLITTQRIIKVKPAPGGPAYHRAPDGEWRSFNIASIGVDAYITDMTNRLKAWLPGDSYKLWLDIATVLYDRLYPPQTMVITGYDDSGTITTTHSGLFLLAAMGISGRRTYGSNKPILPDDDNICLIRQMPLLRKLILKGPIAAGRHRGLPEALLFSANALEFNYPGPILVQMDGEAEALTTADFPLRMERSEPIIRHIGRAMIERPEALTGLP